MTVETGIRPRQCRHRKSPLMRRDRWSYELVVHCSMYQRNRGARPDGRARRGLTYGTNFRHAVEFSRSGRTPLQPFRPASGQPMKLYSVSFARSNRHCPHSRLVCGRGLAASLELGGCPAGPAFSGSVRRTTRTLASHRHVSKQGVRPDPVGPGAAVESLCA